MDFEFLSIVILLSSILVFVIFMILKLQTNKSTANYAPLNLIPGPRKLPLIGHLHLLVGNPTPHIAFRDLADKYGPLMLLQLGEIPFLIVSSVEVAKQVLKTHDINFANRPPMLAAEVMSYNYTDIGFAPYGDYWRYLRRICILELLSLRRVQTFRPIREEENYNMIKWIASNEGAAINMSDRIFISSYDVVTRAALGNKTMEQGKITSLIKQGTTIASGLSIADLYPSIRLLPLITGVKSKIKKLRQQTDKMLDSIIDEHKSDDQSNRAEDLADVLLKYQQDGTELPLTTDNIKAVLMDMFVAGSETSAATVDWGMSELLKSPTSLKRTQEELRRVFDGKGYVDETEFDKLKYLKLVIKEVLRLHPPLPFLVPRQSSQKCEVNGYEIPAKTRLMVNAWAIGRDPKYWKNPDKFIPERFEDNSVDFKGNHLEYIPFGAGRRICPGMSFGLANVEYTLSIFLYHFDWEMPNGIKNEELDMTEEFGAIIRRKHGLKLVPTVARPLKLAR